MPTLDLGLCAQPRCPSSSRAVAGCAGPADLINPGARGDCRCPQTLLPAQSDLELRLHAVVTLRPRSRSQSPPNSRWIESAYTLYYVRGARLVATERGESTSPVVLAARHGGTAWP